MIYEFTSRQKKLLRLIVKRFINTASPVSSNTLVRNCGLNCSPATVRNEMVNLEKMGFIKQPHTSSGRIPTDNGYRVYVDRLMKKDELKSNERENIKCKIENVKGNVSLVLENASQVLGMISRELSIVLTPWISYDVFDRMELIKLTEKKVLVVIHVQSRFTKTVILELDQDLKRNEVEQTTSIINERFSGMTLEKIKSTIRERIRNVIKPDQSLIKKIRDSAEDLFLFSGQINIHTYGTLNILTQPEFTNRDMLESILNLLENRSDLIHLFKSETGKTKITIGRENDDKRLQFLSVIKAHYKIGKEIGAIGVIGPTRMRYNKILPLVDHVAKTVNKYMS
jgi:heat-inducible transcriptional repressor